MQTRRLHDAAAIDIRATVRTATSRAAGAPAGGDGEVWHCSRTPEGPATIRLMRIGDDVEAAAWGAGAGWALDHAPDLIGLADDQEGFRPAAGLIADLHRRNPGLRLGRTLRVFDAILPAVLGQRVTGAEAKASYRRLARSHGDPAPGPVTAWIPPDAATVAGFSYADLHPFGVERSRASAIIEAARRSRRLQEIVAMSPTAAVQRLTAVRGIGGWTAAKVMGAALGDPDAVPVGDYHLPDTVAWALAGEPRADDARMLELLQPYVGQRRRAIVLLKLAGISAPRYGPRNTIRDITSS